ncbi:MULTISPECIES: PTS system trehalose-specific EIIBC component [Mammaliicoccus]|uniref:PTS system trehalose-specific EIIBC component n=1 Tax=Mammaliicoccus TaxID=2803850 RepID=UPI000D1F463B|nr:MULTISPECIES: PTS system trehalose-specific EIIBC component [Mammaliicoccus]PTI38664.1 PTS trehalose transporter subunit IIBC [Mammaliicoccus vitulinus]
MAVKREDIRRIIDAIGGQDNVDAATHCVTRLRLVLNDESKVDKDALDEIELVKGSFAANNQFQIVIGQGTVDEAYKIFQEETGVEESSKDDVKKASEQKMNPFQRLIKLLGDVFIPILPAIVTAGLLLGLNNVLTAKNLFGAQPLVEQYAWLADFANIINVIASTAFIFLPALIGWSAMRVFGGSPILGLVLGLILLHPQLASQYDLGGGKSSEIPVWHMFGLEIKQLNYQGQVLPILFATWVLSVIEKFLAKRVHDSIKMLVVGPVALLITGFLAFIVIGPLALGLGTLITDGIKAIFDSAGWLGGAVYGLFYAPLVITGLHHMFLAVDFQLMGSPLGGTYLWPIVAISNICQGSAAFGAWLVYKKRKMAKEQGLAVTSGISAFLGVTEPAMFGVNLPLKYPFFAAIISSSLLGAFIGANKVLGSVGVGGVPAIISIQREYWSVFGIATLIAMVLPAILTVVLSNFAQEKAKEMVKE